MATYNHFYNLRVYQKCRSFKKNVSEIVKTAFPKSEDFRLKSQILNSSRSITAAYDEEFITRDQLKIFNEAYKECLKEINVYIKYLKSAKELINN